MYTKSMVQIGISPIGTMISVVRGQKLPLFPVAYIQHDEFAPQVCHQAFFMKGMDIFHHSIENFSIVFDAMGANWRVDSTIERSVTPWMVFYLHLWPMRCCHPHGHVFGSIAWGFNCSKWNVRVTCEEIYQSSMNAFEDHNGSSHKPSLFPFPMVTSHRWFGVSSDMN